MAKKNKNTNQPPNAASGADKQYRLAGACRSSGRAAEAVDGYLRALALDPKHLLSLRELAQLFRSMGQNVDALKYWIEAVKLQPDNSDLFCELADTWLAAGYGPQAVGAYQKVLQLQPGMPRGLYGLGCAQIAMGEFVPAIHNFKSALSKSPDWLEAKHNLARCLYEMGEVSAAFQQFQACAADYARNESERARAMAAVVVPGVPEANNKLILEVRRRWAVTDLTAPEKTPSSRRSVAGPRDRLRIGYISSFFTGSNWMKPVWGLINQHDRERFEIHLFSDAESITWTSIEYGYRRHSGDHFFNVFGSSNDSLADLIRKCGIDILVDLNGYSKPQRLDLFNLKPAAVVVGWFNLYGTSGLPSFDYLIGDRHVLPVEEEAYYSEKIRRVSGSWLTFEPISNAPEVSLPPCLNSGGITFGSAASQYKITSEVVGIWSRILAECSSSSLVLKNKHLGAATSREFLHSAFEKNGINRDRVVLEGSEEYLEFLLFYERIDVALETWPYGGATTTTDALWQGVPVIAFDGDRWASRLSVSLLREAGLEEFAQTSLDGYVRLAVELGTSVASGERLTELRAGMRSRLKSSSLCDTRRLASDIEEIYKAIARDHLE